MARLAILFSGRSAGEQLVVNMQKNQQQVRAAMQSTAARASQQILTRGRADIAAAGKYGPRWTGGLHADVVPTTRGYSIRVAHDVPYFKGLQRARTIQGRPLLWVATSFGGAQGTEPREYAGRLVKITRQKGVPLLIDPDSGVVKYVGLSSVHMPQKFHTLQILQEVAQNLKKTYLEQFRKA